jgi:hypothetical protein
MFSAPLQVLAWSNCHSSLHSNCTLQVVGNAAVSICRCSYHLTGNADNSRTVPICPHSHHDPTEIPEPFSNHNTIHLIFQS